MRKLLITAVLYSATVGVLYVECNKDLDLILSSTEFTQSNWSQIPSNHLCRTEQVRGIPLSSSAWNRVSERVDARLKNVLSYHTRSPKNIPSLEQEYLKETCLQEIAHFIGSNTTFNLRSRYNDDQICNAGIWPGACRPVTLRDFTLDSNFSKGIDEATRETAIAAHNTCIQKVSSQKGILFVMLVSDASPKGFTGFDNIAAGILYLLQREQNYVIVHLDHRSSAGLAKKINELLSNLSTEQIARVKTTERRLRTPWGSTGLVLAELTAVAEAVRLPWSWDWVINMSESDLPIRTNTQIVNWISQIPCGHNILSGANKTFANSMEYIETPGARYPGWVVVNTNTLAKAASDFFSRHNSSNSQPFRYARGSQWHMLSRSFLVTILASNQVAEYFDRVIRYDWAVDEVFYQSIFNNLLLFLELGDKLPWMQYTMTHQPATHFIGPVQRSRELSAADIDHMNRPDPVHTLWISHELNTTRVDGASILGRKFRIKIWCEYWKNRGDAERIIYDICSKS